MNIETKKLLYCWHCFYGSKSVRDRLCGVGSAIPQYWEFLSKLKQQLQYWLYVCHTPSCIQAPSGLSSSLEKPWRNNSPGVKWGLTSAAVNPARWRSAKQKLTYGIVDLNDKSWKYLQKMRINVPSIPGVHILPPLADLHRNAARYEDLRRNIQRRAVCTHKIM